MKIIEYNQMYQEDLIQLILQIQQEEFAVSISLEDQPDLLEIDSHYEKFWLAIENNKVIGTIALVLLSSGNAALKKMFVAKDFRGKELGVSKALISSFVDYCQQLSLRQIFLGTTDKFHAAHRFYEKNDFYRIEKNHLPDDFPIVAVDNVFYKKVLL